MTHLLSANCYISASKLSLFFASNIVFCRFQVENMDSGGMTKYPLGLSTASSRRPLKYRVVVLVFLFTYIGSLYLWLTPKI